MFQKILHFIKYNNAMIIILAVVLILGGGALAAGPENIGVKQTKIQGTDNSLLIQADFDNFNMDFKIENIEQDEKYYYVTYGYLDLVVIDSAWQYQLSQKTVKASKKIKEDIGVYMAKYLNKHHEARVRELKQAKSEAQVQGEQKRVEVTEYSGLIGRTLDLAATVFPGYEPVVKTELPTPENFNLPNANSGASAGSSSADDLNKIYNDYVAAHPEIFATPTDSTGSPQAAGDMPGTEVDSTIPETPVDNIIPETPSIPEPESVDIIELPAPEAPAENAAPVESTATPAQ